MPRKVGRPRKKDQNAKRILEALQFEPVRILKRVTLERSDPLWLDPKRIPTEIRSKITAWMVTVGGFTKLETATILRISRDVLYNDLERVRAGTIAMDIEKSVEHIAKDILDTRDALYAKAVRRKDYALAWKIRLDSVAKLQELGLTYKEPERTVVEEHWEFPNLSPNKPRQPKGDTDGNGHTGTDPDTG